MGLDIVLFRADQGGNPELIRESQRKRFAPVELVDKVIDLDARWRKGTSSPSSFLLSPATELTNYLEKLDTRLIKPMANEQNSTRKLEKRKRLKRAKKKKKSSSYCPQHSIF